MQKPDTGLQPKLISASGYGTEFQQTLSQAEIREAYIDIWKGPLSLKIGKMITPWGKGSFFNPTDKLTPLDPTVRSPEEDDMKLGFWGIQAGVNLGRFMKLTATWKPVVPTQCAVDRSCSHAILCELSGAGISRSGIEPGKLWSKLQPLYQHSWIFHYTGMRVIITGPESRYDSFVMDSVDHGTQWP